MNIFGFGPVAQLKFRLEGQGTRPHAKPPRYTPSANAFIEESSDEADIKELQIFRADEPVKGMIQVSMPEGKKLEHVGFKVEMIGQIEILFEKSNHFEFTSSVRELEKTGNLENGKEFLFDFSNVDKQYESYYGINIRLRYFLRATVTRSYASNIVSEFELLTHVTGTVPEINNTIKMEVGIEDCLHIEFEYGKSKYHLKEVVVGKIYFLLVRIKIKHMDLAIIRRESSSSGGNSHNESETITKYEIMDGAPVKGESIPVRLFLNGLNLTPTFRNINNKFSVKYFLNLVLVDEEDRRYFKQQEITLWRKFV